jgi:hypothetical protein
MTPAWLDAVAKSVALFAAASFFFYKLYTGYHVINLALSVRCERTPLDGDRDLVVVFATLTKGDRGSLALHDLQARFTTSGGSQLVPFAGFERSSYRTDPLPIGDRKVLNWSLRSENSPFIRIAPGDAVEVACSATIAKSEVCIIEVAVLGPKLNSSAIGQWKASYVSAPKPMA